MKTLFAAGFLTALVSISPAQAQLLSREAVGGAALGGVLGGVIGHNNGRKTAEGAAIGAGAGLLLGAITHNARREQAYGYSGAYASPPAPPAAYYPTRPHLGVSGAVLGGVAGGVIGHNNGRKTAEGIAIGAGAGLLLGTLAEQSMRPRIETAIPAPAAPAQVSVSPAAPFSETVPPQNTAPPQSTYFQQPARGPMASANTLFGR